MPVRIVTISNNRHVSIVKGPSISIPGQSQIIRRDNGDLLVVGHSLALNGENRERTPNQLVRTCPCCGHYFLRCTSCSHSRLTSRQGGPIACHRYRVIYTDGVCLYNGQANAAAGVGIAFGTRGKARSSMLVGEDPDGQHNNHTKQRAELLAAIHGIQSIHRSTFRKPPCTDRKSHRDWRTLVWVIATNSDDVSKGINKWMPKWKVNKMRLANGHRPDNLDLFLRLDDLITAMEQENEIAICFWRIPSSCNATAHDLAKKGAKETLAVRNKTIS